MAQALAVLKRIVKQDFLSEFLHEIVMKLPTFGPVALSNVLLALASTGEQEKHHKPWWNTLGENHISHASPPEAPRLTPIICLTFFSLK